MGRGERDLSYICNVLLSICGFCKMGKAYLLQLTRRRERTAPWTIFSPLTFMWVPGFKFTLSGLCGKWSPNHITGPEQNLSYMGGWT